MMVQKASLILPKANEQICKQKVEILGENLLSNQQKDIPQVHSVTN